MKSRTNALVTLVLSVALLAVTGLLWLDRDPPGLGLQVPLAGPSTLERAPTAPPDNPRAAASKPQPVPRRDATRIIPVDQADPPRQVRIPSLRLTMPIVATGVLDDGRMELPDDPEQIGWYRFGSGPGERRGSVVLAGHVDSVRHGVGPLARLGSIQEGARITVIAADGSPIRYRVSGVERVRRADLPTERLFDPGSRTRLVIITCGGRYRGGSAGYEDNIVVLARPA